MTNPHRADHEARPERRAGPAPAGDRDPSDRDDFLVARARDRDEAESIVAGLYLPNRVALPRGVDGVDMELTGFRLGAITVGRLTYGQDVRLTTEVASNFHVNLPLSGRALSVSGRSEPHLTEPGTAAVFAPDVPAQMRWSADTVQLCLMIRREALEGELEQSLGRSLDRPLRFTMTMDLRTPVGAGWRGALDLVAGELDHRTGLATHPRTGRHLERLLLDGLLLGQPHNYSEALNAPAPAGPRGAIARALDLLHDRPGEPWTTSTLAREVHVSVRSLQEGFKRDVGTPPMAYLREIRLQRVRTILEGAAPWSTTVEAVATRHGFVHMGRFAASYRASFGEIPSATLARPSREG
jgi:AraC-like DNA-binding protein